MTRSDEKNTSLSRRGVLLLGAGAVCALAPQPALARVAGFLPSHTAAPAKTLSFYSTHTGERVMTTYWANGGYVRDGLMEINNLLRDHRTGEVKMMAPELLDLLHALQNGMETDQPFHVISGYRSAKTNAKLAEISSGVEKKSLHMMGMAIDIRLPGRELADLHRAAQRLRGGGVGLYPNSNFIHMDVGRVRYW